jgi:hypothetical protein
MVNQDVEHHNQIKEKVIVVILLIKPRSCKQSLDPSHYCLFATLD